MSGTVSSRDEPHFMPSTARDPAILRTLSPVSAPRTIACPRVWGRDRPRWSACVTSSRRAGHALQPDRRRQNPRANGPPSLPTGGHIAPAAEGEYPAAMGAQGTVPGRVLRLLEKACKAEDSRTVRSPGWLVTGLLTEQEAHL